ncbi:PREDICTED: IQ calmodulin-binding motif-containing protein 1 isoform X3 [Ficedula albicollis]|uniref:IQ calmodulin-binding motif-containing protein 1 isoform X3 n=1 Tax=Ficedula albicollis TaxID=59894 RepID=UPI000359BF80|nr:PREDICTED: IQ calmodulin-binding motif-containing protein 1 isoform X3 [Ficedula albicollis]
MAATDPQVLALAAQITESREQDIPLLLLKLKGILSSPSLGCEESNKIKQDMYDYGLTQYCLLVLKQDHSQLHGAWATAAQLAEILSHCCVGLEVKEDPEEFYKKFLPSAIDSLLVLGKRLQARFIRAIKEKEKQDFLHWFQIVTDAICWLFGGHIQLAACGLKGLLSKQWTGKGFDREVNQLLDLLYLEQSSGKGGMQKQHQAACIIQAAWRGFQTRKRLKKLPQAVITLQRSFRAKREQELQHLTKQKEDEALKLQMQLQRQRAMRLFHERQLALLEVVHASQVNKYMQEMEEKSALTIQRFWRGYRARRIFHQQKQSLKEHKAAIIIQRAACKFLEKRRRRRPLSPWKEPKGLTDEQRLALQQKVDDYIKLHPASQMSEETSKELHMQAQAKLAQFLLRSRLDQRAAQRREALLAQVNTDVELLMNAPGLAETTEKDLGTFMSRSIPIATKARQSHNTMLKYTRWPWWKKLGDEFMEDDVIPDDAINTELETLFFGGRKSF